MDLVATEQRIAILERAASGRRLRTVGITMLASIPLLAAGLGALAVALASDLIGIIALTSILAAGLQGALFAVVGHRRRVGALNELAAAEAKQLPPARVV